MYQAELYGKWLSAAAGTTDQSKVLIRPDPERLRRTSVLGTAAEVSARLEEILATTPMTELIVVTQLPGLDPRLARRSLIDSARKFYPVSDSFGAKKKTPGVTRGSSHFQLSNRLHCRNEDGGAVVVGHGPLTFACSLRVGRIAHRLM